MILRNSVERTNQKRPLTSLQQAKKLGLSIQTFRKLKKWMNDMGRKNAPVVVAKAKAKSLSSKSSIELNAPYIKIEDRSR